MQQRSASTLGLILVVFLLDVSLAVAAPAASPPPAPHESHNSVQAPPPRCAAFPVDKRPSTDPKAMPSIDGMMNVQAPPTGLPGTGMPE